MCGIAGYFDRNLDQRDLIQRINIMSKELDHRGPDSHGEWYDQNLSIAIAHRRLSVLDLTETGHQPMISSSGRYIISYNVEIYNHRKLRAMISEDNDFSFKGTSDTETILELIERYGVEKTLTLLSGMFAFCVIDLKERLIFLARDRFGEKPLYLGWVNEGFVFSSELTAIRKLPEFNFEISKEALALYVQFTYVPSPFSIYKNIYKLLPGTCCKFSLINPPPQEDLTQQILSLEEGTNIKKYWSTEKEIEISKQQQFSDIETAVTKLDTKLNQVIEEQMISDVPIGSFLSGGIDSSVITSIMQSQSSTSINTFTIGFKEDIFNEAKYAKEVAKYLGTNHHEFYLPASDALDIIPLLPDIYDEPFADSSQIPTYLVSKRARDHFTVALTGDGGDELFGGYNRYFWAENIWKKFSWMPKISRKAVGSSIRSVSPESWDRIYKIIGGKKLDSLGDKAHKLANRLEGVSDLTDLYLSLVTDWDPDSLLLHDTGSTKTVLNKFIEHPLLEDYQENMMHWDTISYMSDQILCKVDRAAMASSLETRAPFLNKEIFSLAWRIPKNYKIEKRQGKLILKKLLRQYVPSQLIDRPKSGFGIPLAQWMRGPLRSWIEDLLDDERLRSDNLFNHQEIKNKWEEHLSGRDWSQSLWTIVMFNFWLDKNR